jgi:hypothetical protein
MSAYSLACKADQRVQSFPVSAIAVAWMSFISIVFLFPTTNPTSAKSMNYTVVVLGGTILLSLVWYYFPKVCYPH